MKPALKFQNHSTVFPFRLFILVLCFNSFLLVLLGWFSWKSYEEWKTTAKKVVRLQELIGVIRTTDEILTMSARMSAATGDMDWEERYLNHEPLLDKAIQEAMQILPDRRLNRAISETDAANRALVDMERRSFDFVYQQQKEKASELLFSPQYKQQKKIYSEGITKTLKYIEVHIEETLKTQQFRALASFVFIVIVFLMSLISWIFILCLASTHLQQRKKIEEELRKSRKFLDGVIENLPEIVFIKDAENLRYTLLNKAVEELLGYAREDLLGKKDHDFFTKEQADEFIQQDREVLASGELMDIPEQHFRTSMNKHRIFHTKKIPVNDSEGKPEYVLGIAVDITERIENDEKIKKMEQERLKNRQFESIGTLAGGIAHDFNNLLQGIIGYITLAQQKRNNPETCSKMLKEAEKALHMTVNLTSQLLTFSEGGSPLKKRLSLRPVIENAVGFSLNGSKLKYRIDTDSRLRDISADENQISRVVQNIVLNADQAMPEGGIIHISARNIELPEADTPDNLSNGPYVKITIRDRGPGIPESRLDRIFDPYFTTKEKRSGLGLTAAFSITRNHGGTIIVDSEQGKGSAFHIYLPALTESRK